MKAWQAPHTPGSAPSPRRARRWRGGLLALFLLTPALAGCLGASGPTPTSTEQPGAGTTPQSAALHSLHRVLPFAVQADDGVTLRGHVYLPNGSGPFATVLELSPYWNTADWGSEDAAVENGNRTTLRDHLGRFLDAGFAVALVNLRGSGESDGCFQLGGPKDFSDSRVIIEALAAEDWSNGNVGMYGLSYPGWTQYLAIAGAAPSLKAVIPSSGVIDAWSLLTRNGAPIGVGPIHGTGATFAPIFISVAAVGVLAPLSGFAPDTHPSHLACPNYPEDSVENAGLLWNGDRSPWWQARDYRPHVANTSVPIFVANGLTNSEGHVLQFEGLWDLIPHEEKRFMLGQWPHAYPDDSDHDATREDFPEMAVAWFDHYLRGGPKTVETGVVEYQDDAGAWHAADRWPPRATATTLHLSDSALVADSNEVVASERTFASVDRRAFPDTCPDAATAKALYVSEPLAEDVLLAGNYRLNVTVTSTLPDGNFAVALWHVNEVWKCVEKHDLESQGLIAEEVALALSDLRHRGHLGHGSDYPVGSPGVMEMVSEPFASVVPAGHRLVLGISGGDSESTPDPRKPTLTITTGPGVTGELVLPVVEGSLGGMPAVLDYPPRPHVPAGASAGP